ncbi:Threonylcarbamoyl-AMP synthase [Dyadobacter sp. CECT 9275]|uniref:Threonylcarbamoyl-AMP synthase n=1 Tax=Dyadobacter helix TaxID=2822344 RepID=A0A916JCF1_9BACT|nr:L-threonylcarbamoyladenylate synthase [Dyadobacter sp. CECT 9275]CAG4998700.1 Threonylcarbamoyl-AMP synthase [Dyadobacter sp. CECT 9275]
MAEIGTDIKRAKEILEEGFLVGIPTETVYGLAGNALNEKAVLSIFETKNRPAFDPLIIHTDSLEKIGDLVSFLPEKALLLARRYWPGPLTLLLPKKTIVPDLVTSGLNTVAVRIPDHPLTLSLLATLDFPLAAPSANPFGYISPTCASHVQQQLGDKIPYILDGGLCTVGVESTIIGFSEDIPTVFRLGGLALEDIEKVIGKVGRLSHSTSNPQAPGMLKSHYAPRKPFVLKDRHTFSSGENSETGYLLYKEYLDGVDQQYQRLLSPGGNMQEAARHLFAYLRELDTLPVTKIEAEFVPDEGLGRAINDRLKRAAAV